MHSLQLHIYDKVSALLSRVRNLDSSQSLTGKSKTDTSFQFETTSPSLDRNIELRASVETSATSFELEDLSPQQLFDPIQVEKSSQPSCQYSKLLRDEINNFMTEYSNVKPGESNVPQWLNVACLKEEALIRQTENVVLDVRSAMDKLLNMLILTYDQLDSAEGRDQCYASMEEPFFKPIWPSLRQLFRLAYMKEENCLEKVMVKLNLVTLKELDVSQNYWGDESRPYQPAIEQMKNIVDHCCPLRKLEALVQVAHLICEDQSRPATSKSVGADDLIPILCFVVIKTELPELISECHAMEQFLQEGYLMGEEGYCLTSMQTVFQYLLSRVGDDV